MIAAIDTPKGEHMGKALAHYLDACIAVKLVTHEPGSDTILAYMKDKWACHFHITEFAFYETLSVLKRKWLNKDITKDNYLSAVFTLQAYTEGRELEIDSDFRLDHPQTVVRLRELVVKHEIDFSDALQIYTVLNGKWQHTVPEWQPVFVTTDKALLKAAKAEGLRIWNPNDGDPPQ
jgi:predicted nucleic acid-binding protein